jgi:hypothetical protein
LLPLYILSLYSIAGSEGVVRSVSAAQFMAIGLVATVEFDAFVDTHRIDALVSLSRKGQKGA